MRPEEKSMKSFKEICKADGEALAKYYEEQWDADKIYEMATGEKICSTRR